VEGVCKSKITINDNESPWPESSALQEPYQPSSSSFKDPESRILIPLPSSDFPSGHKTREKRVEVDNRYDVPLINTTALSKHHMYSTLDTSAIKARHCCSIDGCGQSFGRRKDLQRHEKDLHLKSGTVYRCTVSGCSYGKTNRRKDNFKRHFERMHPEQAGTILGQWELSFRV
jgi:hypothetical protein